MAAQTIIEGESATGELDISVNHRPDADIEFHHRLLPGGLIEGSPDPVVFSRNDWKQNQGWTLTALQDADSEDERVRWGLRVVSDDEQWHSLAVERVTVTVRDDDPEVVSLEAVEGTIVEGGTAVFRLRLSREPLDGSRTVRATLWAAGATLAAGLAEGLADADAEAEGLQLDVALDGVLGGVLEVATVGDEADGPDGLLILSVAQPSDYLSANYFTLADGAMHFTTTVRVLDDDEPVVEEAVEEVGEEPATEPVGEELVDKEPVVEEPVEAEPGVEEPVTFPNTGSGGLLGSGRVGAAGGPPLSLRDISPRKRGEKFACCAAELSGGVRAGVFGGGGCVGRICSVGSGCGWRWGFGAGLR